MPPLDPSLLTLNPCTPFWRTVFLEVSQSLKYSRGWTRITNFSPFPCKMAFASLGPVFQQKHASSCFRVPTSQGIKEPDLILAQEVLALLAGVCPGCAGDCLCHEVRLFLQRHLLVQAGSPGRGLAKPNLETSPSETPSLSKCIVK